MIFQICPKPSPHPSGHPSSQQCPAKPGTGGRKFGGTPGSCWSGTGLRVHSDPGGVVPRVVLVAGMVCSTSPVAPTISVVFPTNASGWRWKHSSVNGAEEDRGHSR